MYELMQLLSSNFIAICLVAIAGLVLVWAANFANLLIKNRSGISRPLYLPYTLYTVFISSWILSNAYFQSSLLVSYGNEAATVMALLANIFSGLAFAFAYLFSCQLVSERRGFKLKRRHRLIFITTCAITISTNLVAGLNVQTVDVSGIGDFVIHFGPTSGLFFGVLLLLIVFTLTNFVKSSRSNVRLQQIKAKYMILGMVAFICSTFLAHFLVPLLFNDFSIAWVPPALSIIEAFLVGYALMHNRFFSCRYLGMLASSFALNVLLYATPIMLLSLKLTDINGFVLVTWTVITGIYWHKTLILFRQRVNRLLYKEKGNPVENICNLIGEFRYSTDQAVVQLNEVLKAKEGRIQKVTSNADNNVFLSCFHGDRSVLVREELEYEIQHNKSNAEDELHDVTRAMVSSGTSLVLPITNENNEVTHLYMVSKENEKELFSSEEIMGLQRLFDEANRFIVTEDKVRKSQVLAGSIAHEIRNPLTKIKYHFERIDADMFGVENGSLTPFASQEMQKLYQELSESKKAVQLGTRFIDAILDELRGGSISTELFSHYSVRELTNQALDDFSFFNDTHKARIKLDAKGDFLFHGSDTLYTFVLMNLLKNAVYYFDAYPQSQISIQISASQGRNAVHVIDTGPGIASEHLANIFEEFYTVGKQEGNGLGLSYCKRVMSSFGGDIMCHSLEGKYTEFVLTFPPIDELQQQQEIQTELRQKLAGKVALVLSGNKRVEWLTDTLESVSVQASLLGDIELALDSDTLQYVDFIVIERELAEQHKAKIDALRHGHYGHQAQVIPLITFSTKPQALHDNHRQSGALSQGHLSDVHNGRTFLRAFSTLVSEGKLVKLGSLAGKHVLVVDDMQVNRMLVQAYLVSEGVTVSHASSGEEAIEMVQAQSFDAIFMDIHMPGRNGIETTHVIRSFGIDIPVIALSGEYSEEAREAVKAVMQDHLVKPITKQQLLGSLITCLFMDDYDAPEASSNEKAKQ